MYIDPIDQYLKNQTKTISIPEHALVDSLNKKLRKIELERCWLFLNYLFFQNRHLVEIGREVCGIRLSPYEVLIFSTTQVAILGHFYQKKIMGVLIETGIITLNRKSWFSLKAGIFRPSIYKVNEKVFKAKFRIVNLSYQKSINTWTSFLKKRQSSLNRTDKDIVDKNHRFLRYAISGFEYAKKYRKEEKKKGERRAIDNGFKFDPKEWKKKFIYRCRQIDNWNQVLDKDKWMICREDNFGNRLHHMLTHCPISLRKHTRLGDLVPLFEIDLSQSLPFFTARQMIADGVCDPQFFQDINNSDVYEKYASHFKISRERAKIVFFSGFCGEIDSFDFKKAESFYPITAQYLRKIKTENRLEESKTITDYKPSKNNCIDVQRAESAWAHKVWKDLTKTGIRFLPIHDSILVYGNENTLSEKIGMMQSQVENIMKSNFTGSAVNPKFKITEYLNSDGFGDEQSEETENLAELDFPEDFVKPRNIEDQTESLGIRQRTLGNPLTPEIGVFFCVWKRLDRLQKSLSQLKQQTFKSFDLYIINNNPSAKSEVERIVHEGFSDSGITYKIIHCKVNHGPMIRYAFAAEAGYPYSVFLDDDEEFRTTMMDTFDKFKEHKALKAYMGFNFDRDIKSRKRVINGNAKVLGPGGLILDTSILEPDFFDKWKLEFYVCDDLWLSFYAEKKGYKKEVSDIGMFMLRESDTSLAMLYNENIADLKQKFIEDYGWFETK